jgi:uncharacterized protein YciI
MDFFIDSRAVPPSRQPPDDLSLDEQHWTYMDGFSDRMIARGPTLGGDRQTWTGSLHVLDLADAETAREFVHSEPYHRAGLFAQHRIWRFTNLPGRTMWQFARTDDGNQYLGVALRDTTPSPLPAAPYATQFPHVFRSRLILHGLLYDSDSQPDGVAFIVQTPTRDAAETLLRNVSQGLHDHGDVTIRDWTFGGRR